jgi:hypothetical protein
VLTATLPASGNDTHKSSRGLSLSGPGRAFIA